MSNQDTVKIWTKDSVIALLNTNNKAVVKAIKGLNARQTAEERSERTAKITNGRGFNKRDAAFLCDIAAKLPRYNDNMTPRQLYVARIKLRKYWRQLLEMIEENGGQVAFPKGTKSASKPATEIAGEEDSEDEGEEGSESEIVLATEVAGPRAMAMSDSWTV